MVRPFTQQQTTNTFVWNKSIVVYEDHFTPDCFDGCNIAQSIRFPFDNLFTFHSNGIAASCRGMACNENIRDVTETRNMSASIVVI